MVLYIHAWWENFEKKSSTSMLRKSKNAIFNSHVKPKLQKEFSKRLDFAFQGSNASQTEILNFLSNTSKGGGFLQKLQQEYNQGCQRYFSQPPQILYKNIPITSHKELKRRVKIEQEMIEHAGKIEKGAKEYAMAILLQEGVQKEEIMRILNLQSVQNGRAMKLKSVQKCSRMAQEAVKEYSKAAMCANNLRASLPGTGDGSHSSFAETARQMRSLMGELTSNCVVREVGKKEQMIANAMWGGSLKGGSLSKIIGKGGSGSLAITRTTIVDPKWQKDIEKNNKWSGIESNYTLKEDTMVFVKEGSVQGFYGISVKDYSGLSEDNPWVAIDTYGGTVNANIKTAMDRAVRNGMPGYLGDDYVLYNLAMAQYGKKSQSTTMTRWNRFIDTIVMFNALDSLMGRKSSSGDFKYGMNNLFMIINGQVLFMKDIIDRLTGDTFMASTGFGKENKFSSYRTAAEAANHAAWKKYRSGMERTEYLLENEVPALLKIQLQTKIDIAKLGLYAF